MAIASSMRTDSCAYHYEILIYEDQALVENMVLYVRLPSSRFRPWIEQYLYDLHGTFERNRTSLRSVVSCELFELSF